MVGAWRAGGRRRVLDAASAAVRPSVGGTGATAGASRRLCRDDAYVSVRGGGAALVKTRKRRGGRQTAPLPRSGVSWPLLRARYVGDNGGGDLWRLRSALLPLPRPPRRAASRQALGRTRSYLSGTACRTITHACLRRASAACAPNAACLSPLPPRCLRLTYSCQPHCAFIFSRATSSLSVVISRVGLTRAGTDLPRSATPTSWRNHGAYRMTWRALKRRRCDAQRNVLRRWRQALSAGGTKNRRDARPGWCRGTFWLALLAGMPRCHRSALSASQRLPPISRVPARQSARVAVCWRCWHCWRSSHHLCGYIDDCGVALVRTLQT